MPLFTGPRKSMALLAVKCKAEIVPVRTIVTNKWQLKNLTTIYQLIPLKGSDFPCY